ncbi:hypothetical protein BDE02_04G202800, partial [Populus trichocarpa]
LFIIILSTTFVFPAILSAVLGLSSQDHQNQLYEAKLRITQSESRLEEITQNINDRDRYLERCENLIGELDHKLNHLQSVFSHLKVGWLVADDKIKDLEEEVRVLWATLRKNNFDIHVLESKAREAEDRLQMVTSQVQKMEDIVSERWIQIQQFEQALQLKEIRLKAQRQARPPRWTFLKFFSYLSGEYLPNAHGLLIHISLQVFVKQEMERHEFTACLANQEIVFFVASALIIFPVLSAWILLSSQLC